ncbi:MAG: hypothetical protein KDI46_03675 [Alphaproteobacteria bacterium]|nr:hypothetical protein [Alphaproteobacteria bacterium]
MVAYCDEMSPIGVGRIWRNSTTHAAFCPRTQTELTIFDFYNECKALYGSGFALIYTDNFDRKDKFEHVEATNLDAHALIKRIQTGNMDGAEVDSQQRVLAILDLGKPFEEQWPYSPGTVKYREQLVKRPVISPQVICRDDMDFKSRKPYQGLFNNGPLKGIVQGGKPPEPVGE